MTFYNLIKCRFRGMLSFSVIFGFVFKIFNLLKTKDFYIIINITAKMMHNGSLIVFND